MSLKTDFLSPEVEEQETTMPCTVMMESDISYHVVGSSGKKYVISEIFQSGTEMVIIIFDGNELDNAGGSQMPKDDWSVYQYSESKSTNPLKQLAQIACEDLPPAICKVLEFPAVDIQIVKKEEDIESGPENKTISDVSSDHDSDDKSDVCTHFDTQFEMFNELSACIKIEKADSEFEDSEFTSANESEMIESKTLRTNKGISLKYLDSKRKSTPGTSSSNACVTVHAKSPVHKNDNLIKKEFEVTREKRKSVYGSSLPAKGTFTCPFCAKTLTTQVGIKLHERACQGIKPFECDICGHKFTQKGALRTHYNSHVQGKPLSCKICDKKFKHMRYLKEHIQTKHENKFKFKCSICSLTFLKKHAYMDHMNMHTGIKPWICDVCGKSFTQQSTLNKHKMAHVNGPQYVCYLCVPNLRYKHMNSMRRHVKVVHPEHASGHKVGSGGKPIIGVEVEKVDNENKIHEPVNSITANCKNSMEITPTIEIDFSNEENIKAEEIVLVLKKLY